MDQTVARIMESLERMLLAKAISPADYLEGVAAAHCRAASSLSPPRDHGSSQEVVKEELVKVEAPVTKAPVVQEALVQMDPVKVSRRPLYRGNLAVRVMGGSYVLFVGLDVAQRRRMRMVCCVSLVTRRCRNVRTAIFDFTHVTRGKRGAKGARRSVNTRPSTVGRSGSLRLGRRSPS